MARKSERAARAEIVEQTERVVPIDLVHLARQTMGDRALETEVLGIFSHISETYVQRLRKSLNRDEFALNLHALKGAAAGVGASPVATIAKSAEVELQRDGSVSPSTLEQLAAMVSETRLFIEQMTAAAI